MNIYTWKNFNKINTVILSNIRNLKSIHTYLYFDIRVLCVCVVSAYGYRLTQSGYDFLAIKALCNDGAITSFGNQIGTGKESDVYVVRGASQASSERATLRGSSGRRSRARHLSSESAPLAVDTLGDRASGSGNGEERELCAKLHRLGRTCFRQLKRKRDYLGSRRHAGWLYMARLAAQKEFAFLQTLHAHQFPVPKPLAINRLASN